MGGGGARGGGLEIEATLFVGENTEARSGWGWPKVTGQQGCPYRALAGGAGRQARKMQGLTPGPCSLPLPKPARLVLSVWGCMGVYTCVKWRGGMAGFGEAESWAQAAASHPALFPPFPPKSGASHQVWGFLFSRSSRLTASQVLSLPSPKAALVPWEAEVQDSYLSLSPNPRQVRTRKILITKMQMSITY